MAKRLAIVGSRDYPRLDLVRAFISKLKPSTVVVSGGARGVDRCAAEDARARGLEVVEILADWSQGKSAGPKRNLELVASLRDGDGLVAFWDGKSTGTEHVFSLAQERGGLWVRVYGPDGEVITPDHQR